MREKALIVTLSLSPEGQVLPGCAGCGCVAAAQGWFLNCTSFPCQVIPVEQELSIALYLLVLS